MTERNGKNLRRKTEEIQSIVKKKRTMEERNSMEGIIEGDFISQFHKIEGDLVSERKKNLFKLLRNTSIPVNDEVIKNLCPKTYLESLFKIDVLIYHKKTEELIKIFKEGNEIFVKKILKQEWVFQEMLRTLNPNEIVSEFFPSLSYSLRMKMLKKLAVVFQEHKMDEIYNCLFERYGLFFASRILQYCTSKKIKEVLALYEIELTPKQLKFIFDKDQDFFIEYLDYYKKLKRRHYQHKNLCKYVALKNPKLWLKLQEDEKISSCSVGRRNSKKIIKLMKSDVIENISKYTKLLSNIVIVRELRGNFNDVYFNLFPKNVDEINMSNFCNTLLKYYPKKRQWDLFTQTFSKVFDINILDNLNYLNSSFVPLIPEQSITNKWAHVKYKLSNEDYLLKFCDPNEAIPLIKQKINVTSDIYRRRELVLLLIENCAENKDLTSLTSVLQYICKRHRNEEVHFHNNLLSKILNLFLLQDFNETHWDCINEIITVQKAKQVFSFFNYSQFLERYLEYLFLNKKPYKTKIEEYVATQVECFSYRTTFNFKFDNPQIEMEILTQIINCFPEVATKDYKYFNHCTVILINDIINFSRKYPQYSINLLEFPILVTYIESVSDQADLNDAECGLIMNTLLYGINFPDKRMFVESKIIQIFLNNKKQQSRFEDIWKIFIMKKERSEFENGLLHTYFNDIFDDWVCTKMVIWLMRNEPRTLIPYFDNILKKCLNYSLIISPKIKLMSHLHFDRKIIDYCTKKLCLDEGNYAYEIVPQLSILLSTEDFIKTVVEPYMPATEKLDTSNEEMVKLFHIQRNIALNMKRVAEPIKMLPFIMKFSLGDYLQVSLPSLYSIFYRSPEKLLYNYIEGLSQKAVSARKHALFLSCELLNFNYVNNKIKTIKEKNVSSQKYIFSATIKYFVKNQSEDLFNMVILNLSRIDENDEETLKKLVKIAVPSKYLPLYIEKCWQFYESMREKEVNITDYLYSILGWFARGKIILISLLPREFCVYIIDNYFKEQKNEILSNIGSFVCKFLKDRRTERAENFKYVFEILSVLKINKRLDDINNIYKLLYQSSNDKNDMDFFQRFLENWILLFTQKEKFDEYVSLKLLQLQLESGTENQAKDYAKGIVSFLDKLVLKYGQMVYEKFKTNLIKTVNFSSKEKYIFLLTILKCKISTITCTLVFDLISPPSSNEKEDVVLIYNEILEILKNVDDPLVQIYFESTRF